MADVASRDPLVLRVPPEEGRRLIQQRVEEGRRLYGEYANAYVPQFQARVQAWTDGNRLLIDRTLFGLPHASNEVYNFSTRVGRPQSGANPSEIRLDLAEEIERHCNHLDGLAANLEGYAVALGPAAAATTNGQAVFLIHGHDLAALRTVKHYVESLADVRVLSERPDIGTPTVIEKLERESQGVGYAIAIVTPDDPGIEDQRRARQNVLLELGFFIGRLGRGRIKILKRGEVEWMTDLDGALWTALDEENEWMSKIREELQIAGIRPPTRTE